MAFGRFGVHSTCSGNTSSLFAERFNSSRRLAQSSLAVAAALGGAILARSWPAPGRPQRGQRDINQSHERAKALRTQCCLRLMRGGPQPINDGGPTYSSRL
jgi:hypothetical protein